MRQKQRFNLAAVSTAAAACTLMTIGPLAPRAAAQPSPAPPGPVVVDVTVVDAKGEPVSGLTADRFRVTLGGRTQAVRAAELVRSDPTAGRSVMLVLDQSSVPPGGEALLVELARGLVKRLAPGDRVGVLALPQPGPRAALTADHASVLEAIGAMRGQQRLDSRTGRIGLGEALAAADGDPLAIGVITDRECVGIGDTIESQTSKADGRMSTGWLEQPVGECVKRNMKTIDRLAAEATRAGAPIVPGVVEALGTLTTAPGARAAVIVTAGLATGRREPALAEMTARAVATGASVQALLLDPAQRKGRGVPVNRQTERRGLSDRLNQLTIAARGAAAVATPESAGVFDALLREITGYYSLTVAIDDRPAGRDARQAGLVRVEVPNAKLIVRARPFLYDVGDAGSDPKTAEMRVAEALSGAGVARDELSVRASGVLRVGANRTTSLMISGEVDLIEAGTAGPEPPAADGSALAMSYALFDKDNQPVSAGALPLVGAPGPSHLRSFLGRLGGVEPGRYLLRLAAIDAAGRMGSVERALDLRTTEAAGLAAGDVLLARVEPGQPEAFPSPDEIGADTSIVMQVDVAAEPRLRKTLGGEFIVSHRGGGEVTREAAQLVVDEAAGMARLAATLGSDHLAPGDYEVVASLTGSDAALTTRARPLTIVPGSARTGEGAAGPALPKALLAPLTPSFARARMLDASVLAPVFTRLESRASSPAARAAIARARTSSPDALVVDAGLRRQDPVAAAFLAGVAHFAKGELEPAAVQFREALRGDAEFAPAIVYLGACYAAGGRDREAAGAWQTALISETEDPLLPTLLADAWLRADDADAALEIVDEASERWPANRELSAQRVTALLTVGRTADALAALDAFADARADQLFAAMRVLVDAHSAGRVVVSAEADRQRLQAYADRYASANGPQQPLVASWLAAWK